MGKACLAPTKTVFLFHVKQLQKKKAPSSAVAFDDLNDGAG